MTATDQKAKLLSWDWDLRVRDRHLAAGIIQTVLSGYVGASYLSALPDLEAQMEVLSVEQPAMGTGVPPETADPGADTEDDPTAAED